MRLSALTLATSLALAATVLPRPVAAELGHDFVFTDEDGHLVLRFAGADAGPLDADQLEEIVNPQLSTMVHDRLQADNEFDAEPVDPAWADATASRIETHMQAAAPEFTAIHTECRSASCRLVLDHASTWRVSDHQSLMDVAERAIRSYIETHPASFEAVFLIAAHYQEPDRPYMKVFVHRARSRDHTGS